MSNRRTHQQPPAHPPIDDSSTSTGEDDDAVTDHESPFAGDHFMVPIHTDQTVAIGNSTSHRPTSAPSRYRDHISSGGNHGNVHIGGSPAVGRVSDEVGGNGGMSGDAPNYVVRSNRASARSKIRSAAQTSAVAAAETMTAVAIESAVKDQIASLNNFEVVITLSFIITLTALHWPDAPPSYLSLLVVWHLIISIPLIIHGWIIVSLTFLSDAAALSVHIFLWTTNRDTADSTLKTVFISILLVLTSMRIIITSACATRCGCTRPYHMRYNHYDPYFTTM